MKIEYSNGFYVGDVVNGNKHGKGKYYWSSGVKYDGDWVND